MAQTSYSNSYSAIGFEGMLADTKEADIVSELNAEASANLVFGRGVRKTAAGGLLMSAAGQSLAGIPVFHQRDTSHLDDNGAIAPDETFDLLRKGRILVLAEQAVAVTDDVYLRYSAGTGDQTVGRFRKDPDGTAQVDTVTPTAVNSTEYNLVINGRAYVIVSDGSATATEICDAFRTKIAADPDCAVTGSGTTTLILTADVAGVPFVTQVGANLALANTTPNAAKAERVANARWASATSAADQLAVLELNLP
jgi:hypothetical protein